METIRFAASWEGAQGFWWQRTATDATEGQVDNESVSWINISAQATWFSLGLYVTGCLFCELQLICWRQSSWHANELLQGFGRATKSNRTS